MDELKVSKKPKREKACMLVNAIMRAQASGELNVRMANLIISAAKYDGLMAGLEIAKANHLPQNDRFNA